MSAGGPPASSSISATIALTGLQLALTKRGTRPPPAAMRALANSTDLRSDG